MTTSQPKLEETTAPPSSEVGFTRGDVKKVIEHFSGLMGMQEDYPQLKTMWYDATKSLLESAGVSVSEFLDFLTWAAEDNTSDIGGMNSVEYLMMAKDKMVSLTKNFDTLFRVYTAKQKSSRVKRRNAATLMPRDVAEWLMNGPGVNTPATGWLSARDKLNEIKRAWYGKVWESMPDPDIEWERLFEDAQRRHAIQPEAERKRITDPDAISGTANSLFPEEFKNFMKLSYQERYKLELSAPRGWQRDFIDHVVTDKILSGWTHEEKDAVTKGEIPCPVCGTTGHEGTYIEWQVNTVSVPDESGSIVSRRIWRDFHKPCKCQGWKWVWKQVLKGLYTRYEYANVHTLKSDYRSRLPKDVQEQEIGWLQRHSNESFLFLGPPGTSKTTFSYALYREAFERDTKFFWNPTANGKYEYDKTRWIWRGNFNSLLHQFNAKQKDRDGTVSEPEVTQEMIKAAGRVDIKLPEDERRHPVLIIEEVDKIDLNSHRVDYLFHLLDEITNIEQGKLVMTSNLSLCELYQMLTANDEVRSTGETIFRRIIDSANVRDYFKYKQD